MYIATWHETENRPRWRVSRLSRDLLPYGTSSGNTMFSEFSSIYQLELDPEEGARVIPGTQSNERFKSWKEEARGEDDAGAHAMVWAKKGDS